MKCEQKVAYTLRPIAPTCQPGWFPMKCEQKVAYTHPKTILEFEVVYRKEYEQELESCDNWIKWCNNQDPPDTHGINFHEGKRAAHVFNNIKMGQLLRVLKQQEPNKLPVEIQK